MFAATAIVKNGTFTHYCHTGRSFMVLRIHHKACPLCSVKNPEYIPNKLVYSVINMDTGNVELVFSDMQKACKYISKYPDENLAVGDVGYVN